MNQNFHDAGDDANEWINEGPRKLALVADQAVASPLLRLTCRDIYSHSADEQQLLAHISDYIRSSGYAFSQSLLTQYYVSLKTNPFVVLTGDEGRGKTELVQLFAEALVGRNCSQYALIPGCNTWPNGTGEDHYYRSLQERFCSWRFLELLQDAAHPGNSGKVYLACFDALHPSELEYYFARLLCVTPTGEKRLNLPGFPPGEQPIVPSNMYITATVDLGGWNNGLSRDVLRHAGLIEFRAPLSPHASCATRIVAPPPVGYQRLWLRAACNDVVTARVRLAQILGGDRMGRLHCSPQLSQLLWRAGVVLSTQMLHELTAYIANSFDTHGRGLFDPHDQWHNAQLAYDAQVVQRVLWRLQASSDVTLRRDLTDYLDHVAVQERQQAVA